MRRVCITGGAGFIGSTVADALAAAGVEVVIVDDFRTGRREFIEQLLDDGRAELVRGDVLDASVLSRAFAGCDWVFHLQANADVRHGLEHPRHDLEQNTIATSGVLEAMREAGVQNILFSSTGSIYGEPEVFPTPEDAPFPIQTSLYGASKLACEGLIAAYAEGFSMTAVICRFVSIVGERYTHGHVVDFYQKLKRDPSSIEVLGDGRQEKSYLYVGDCIEAMLLTARTHEGAGGTHIYNLGTDETIVIDDSLKIITDYLGVSPKVTHSGGPRGWVGDSPLIHLDTTRIKSLGWRPQLSIAEAVQRTVAWLDKNDEVTAGGPN
jgi:UDP-glucose 4-epimerase